MVLFIIIAAQYLNGYINLNITNALLILTATLSPIAWGEFTKGVQLGRSYQPGFIGILLLTGYEISILQETITPPLFWSIFLILIGLILAWNLKILISDVYPARMAITKLIAALQKRNITEFYTYKTDYNNSFVNAINLNHKIAGKFKINYINKIEEIINQRGWIVIPCVSSKAFHMESEKEGITNGDFDTKDPILFKLIATKEIERIAEEKFKTYGTSRIWVHESEVSSYRDLILKEVKAEDLFKGYAWLVKIDKIKNFIQV